jgi:hypothetical protein
MRLWRLVLLAIITVIVQVSILPNISIGSLFPNLVFVILLVFLLSEQEISALWWIAIAGFFLEIYSPYFFGFYLLQLGITFIIFRFVLRQLLREPSLFSSILVFALFSLFINIFQFVIIHNPLSSVLFPIVFYEVIVGLVIYRISYYLNTLKAPIKIR